MRFVIDETSFKFNQAEPDVCIESLESLLDRIDDAEEQGHATCYSEDLFNTEVYPGKSFYDLYSEDSPVIISREVQERVSSIFSKLPKWQELDLEWPDSFEIIINGHMQEAPSIAWAHKQTSIDSANSIGCLVLTHVRSGGLISVTVSGNDISLWSIGNYQNYLDFFRHLIENYTSSPNQMASLAHSAFPSLNFVGGSFGGIKDMSKPYKDIVSKIVQHLGVLSDHGERAFSGPWDHAAAELGALGVNASDENGKTKSNKNARKARTLELAGTEVTFWWHTKLGPDRDRIHFYPNKVNNGGVILIGIFCRHLTT